MDKAAARGVGARAAALKEKRMKQRDWVSGDTAPQRHGYYETRFDTGDIAVTLYSALGWLPANGQGAVVGWRALPPALEREEAERHLESLRSAPPQWESEE